MFPSTYLAALAGLAAFAITARAQTTSERQAQIQACANSIQMTSYQSVVTYSTADTAQFTATFSYDPALCNISPTIPVTRPTLQNTDTLNTVACTTPTFGTSGVLFTTCSKTHGAMAIEARDDNAPDQAITIGAGSNPTVYVITNYFTVAYTDPPTPSSRRRQLARANEQQFQCVPGTSYCWTGVGKNFACVNTSSDVLACGACRFDDSAVDCTSIVGADDVECKNARCFGESLAPPSFTSFPLPFAFVTV